MGTRGTGQEKWRLSFNFGADHSQGRQRILARDQSHRHRFSRIPPPGLRAVSALFFPYGSGSLCANESMIGSGAVVPGLVLVREGGTGG